MIVIGDVAGQFDALMRLVDKLPDKELVFVGDLVDRGPNSKEVVSWVMNKNHKCVLGNHEHMMLKYYRPGGTYGYDSDVWIWNGGNMTNMQYRYKDQKPVLNDHLDWIEQLPLYIKTDDILISHAPWIPEIDLEDSNDNLFDVIWNRDVPEEREEFQVFGHNSPWGLRWFGSPTQWGVCIDASSSGVLTAFDFETGKVYQEPYLKGSK
jgi:serine/threonine protein phosphatase 1